MPELTNQKIKPFSGNIGINQVNIMPRLKKIIEIKTNAKRVNGNLRMTLAADKPYIVQIESNSVINEVATVGYQWPCSANIAISSPAPKKRYQSPPKRMQPK